MHTIKRDEIVTCALVLFKEIMTQQLNLPSFPTLFPLLILAIPPPPSLKPLWSVAKLSSPSRSAHVSGLHTHILYVAIRKQNPFLLLLVAATTTSALTNVSVLRKRSHRPEQIWRQGGGRGDSDADRGCWTCFTITLLHPVVLSKCYSLFWSKCVHFILDKLYLKKKMRAVLEHKERPYFDE